MADENVFNAEHTVNSLVVTEDTKIKIVDSIQRISDLPSRLTVPNEHGVGEQYAIVLVGDRAKAVLGDRFTNGDKLCVRIGDPFIIEKVPVYSTVDVVTDSSRGSKAGGTGKYTKTITKVLPDDAVIGTQASVEPTQGKIDRDNPVDMVGAMTWPPTTWRERYYAQLYTITAANELVKHTRLKETVEVF